MGRIEKTIFISYRRTNFPWALAIYRGLTSQGFDVFFDYSSIKSGDFERIIAQNVRGRAHFVVLLTPSALDRCNEPGDWLRREIELAIDEKRNIVPVFLEGFSFSSPSVAKYLTGKLKLLKKYNGMTAPAEYFEAAMARLCNEFLSIPLTAVLHPISDKVQKVVTQHKNAANRAKQVKQNELTAQEWFERGNKCTEAKKYTKAIHCYNEAIRDNPEFPEAFNARGNAHYDKGKLDAAITDYNKAIRLKPDYDTAFNQRGNVRYEKRNFGAAIRDYNKAIDLRPHYIYLSNRGNAHANKGQLRAALSDYNKAIRLKPDYAEAFKYRGDVRYKKGDFDAAIKDYTKAIQLKPDYAAPYGGRGDIWWAKQNYELVIEDYQKFLDFGGTAEIASQRITEAKKKIKN